MESSANHVRTEHLNDGTQMQGLTDRVQTEYLTDGVRMKVLTDCVQTEYLTDGIRMKVLTDCVQTEYLTDGVRMKGLTAPSQMVLSGCFAREDKILLSSKHVSVTAMTTLSLSNFIRRVSFNAASAATASLVNSSDSFIQLYV